MELVLSEGVVVTGVALLEVLVELPSVLAGVLMVRLYPTGNTSVGIQLYGSTPGRLMNSGGLRTVMFDVDRTWNQGFFACELSRPSHLAICRRYAVLYHCWWLAVPSQPSGLSP